jgi:hypothetical protein
MRFVFAKDWPVLHSDKGLLVSALCITYSLSKLIHETLNCNGLPPLQSLDPSKPSGYYIYHLL